MTDMTRREILKSLTTLTTVGLSVGLGTALGHARPSIPHDPPLSASPPPGPQGHVGAVEINGKVCFIRVWLDEEWALVPLLERPAFTFPVGGLGVATIEVQP